MTTICPVCNNFVYFTSDKNKLFIICNNGHKTPFDGTGIIETYSGSEQTRSNILTDTVMENLSYETTMPHDTTITCKKCKTYAVYAIEPATDLFKYACPKCHTVIHID